MGRRTAPSDAGRRAAIVAALATAANLEGVAAIRVALGEFENGLRADVPAESWLSAELRYGDGDFRRAAETFAAFDELGRECPPWMRYLSKHRQSFSLLQLGDFAGCERLIDQADGIIEAHPEIEKFRADVWAMRAHVAEIRLQFDLAWALFERAFDAARCHEYRSRMRTVASDLARVALLLGKVDEGFAWTGRARELADPRAVGPLLALDVREGMLCEVARQWVRAEELYRSVVERAALGSSAIVDAEHRLGEVMRATGRPANALPHYDTAIAEAVRGGLSRHEAYAHLGKAGVLAELGRTDEAKLEFDTATTTGLPREAKPAALVLDLLDFAITWPRVVGLRGDEISELQSLAEKVAAARSTAIIQRGTRHVQAERALGQAVRLLRAMVTTTDDLVALVGCELDVARSLIHRNGHVVELSESLRTTVHVLLEAEAPLFIEDLAEAIGLENGAVETRLSRLKKVLPKGALVVEGGGRARRRYSLARAER